MKKKAQESTTWEVKKGIKEDMIVRGQILHQILEEDIDIVEEEEKIEERGLKVKDKKVRRLGKCIGEELQMSNHMEVL